MGLIRGMLWTVVALAAIAGTAGASNDGATASGTTSNDVSAGSATGQAQATVGAEAETPKGHEAAARLKAIRARAHKMSDKAREALDKKLSEVTAGVDAEVTAKGEAQVADRLAADFQMTSEALTSERAGFSIGWGELMLAHTLLANANHEVTLEQLFELHGEGLGWGQIAFGLGLKPNGITAAARSEGLVARGQTAPDGKVARVEPQAHASGNAGVNAGGKTAGVGTAAGGTAAGVSVGATGKLTR